MAKFEYVWNIMLCVIFKFHWMFLSTIQTVESLTPPGKYEAADSTVCMVLKKV